MSRGLTRYEVNDYYHGEVHVGSGISADYVVAHGLRQLQRGRNPSVAYANKNHDPKDQVSKAQLFGWNAFVAAQADLIIRRQRVERGLDGAELLGSVVLLHTQTDKPSLAHANKAAAGYRAEGATGVLLVRTNTDAFMNYDYPGAVQIMIPGRNTAPTSNPTAAVEA
jgi:hypothetical protein